MGAIPASLISVVLVSLVSFAGLATLSLDEQRARRLATFFVCFAVGALLGDAFIHLVPETFARQTTDRGSLASSLAILGGMMMFFVIEKLLRHQHGALHRQHHGPDAALRPELAVINVAGDLIHNFVDGVLIAASYLAGPTLGVTTTVAVLLHEIPQELGDLGILVHSGLGVRRAVFVNAATAGAAILGTIAALAVGSAVQGTVQWLIPITAGGFVYLAAADLIPELQHDRSLRALIVQAPLIALGIAAMGLLALIE